MLLLKAAQHNRGRGGKGTSAFGYNPKLGNRQQLLRGAHPAVQAARE